MGAAVVGVIWGLVGFRSTLFYHVKMPSETTQLLFCLENGANLPGAVKDPHHFDAALVCDMEDQVRNEPWSPNFPWAGELGVLE
jgi:hypothetical protein